MLPPQKHYTNLQGNLTKKIKCLGLGGLLGGMGGFGIDWYITVVVDSNKLNQELLTADERRLSEPDD